MGSKSYLVAQRELFENLRTKTFWIGIFVFPVILILAIVVPSLLEQNRSTRTYAVVDHSGWLLGAIEERATLPDFAKVFRLALDHYRQAPEAFAELPVELRQMTEQLATVAEQFQGKSEGAEASGDEASGDDAASPDGDSNAFEDRMIDGFASAVSGFQELQGTPMGDLMPAEALAEFERLQDAVRLWWNDLPDDEAEALGSVATRLYERVEIDTRGLSNDELIEDLNQRVADKELFAYFVIGEDPVEGSDGSRYVSGNLTDDDLRRWFSGLASSVVREKRLARHDIDAEVVRFVQEPIRFELKRVGARGAEEEVQTQDLVRQWAPVVFVYLLWIAIFSISQMLLTNTVEEKSNRIMEVLLSSVSPVQLMAGKIVGIALTGLTMVGSWVFFFYMAVRFVPSWLGLELDFDLGIIAADPIYVVSFVVYFLLGYLFFATLFVGIGSLCNSLKEAQNLQTPVTILLMVPLFSMVPVAKDPNGTLAQVLSYIPPFTPFVMMNRAAGPPSPFEYVATTVLLLLAIAAALWGTTKVFRIGILMTGKPPKLSEILKWMRAPVGAVPERRED